MLLALHQETPNKRDVHKICECLLDGGVIVYPTDTVYGFGCDIFNQKAVERIARIKGIKPEKNTFSFICSSIAQLAEYVQPLDNSVFRMIKRNTPGAFTFLLNANNRTPKLLQNKRKTVGVRIPNNTIALTIVEELGRPILSSSVKLGEDEFGCDPEEIETHFGKLTDIIIDGGFCSSEPSTIVDCTTAEIEIVRAGKGELI